MQYATLLKNNLHVTVIIRLLFLLKETRVIFGNDSYQDLGRVWHQYVTDMLVI